MKLKQKSLPGADAERRELRSNCKQWLEFYEQLKSSLLAGSEELPGATHLAWGTHDTPAARKPLPALAPFPSFPKLHVCMCPNLLPTGSLLRAVLAGDAREWMVFLIILRSLCLAHHSSLFRVPYAQLTIVNPSVLEAGLSAFFRGSCKFTALCFHGTAMRPGEAEGGKVILLSFDNPVVFGDYCNSQFLSHPGLDCS